MIQGQTSHINSQQIKSNKIESRGGELNLYSFIQQKHLHFIELLDYPYRDLILNLSKKQAVSNSIKILI
jgi:hypothetical protein